MNTVEIGELGKARLALGDIVVYDDMVCICCTVGKGTFALFDLSYGIAGPIYGGEDAFNRMVEEIQSDPSARIIGPCKITLTPEVEK